MLRLSHDSVQSGSHISSYLGAFAACGVFNSISIFLIPSSGRFLDVSMNCWHASSRFRTNSSLMDCVSSDLGEDPRGHHSSFYWIPA